MIGLPFCSPHSHEHFAVDVCRTLLVPEQEVGGEEGNHVQASSCRSTLLPFLNCWCAVAGVGCWRLFQTLQCCYTEESNTLTITAGFLLLLLLLLSLLFLVVVIVVVVVVVVVVDVNVACMFGHIMRCPTIKSRFSWRTPFSSVRTIGSHPNNIRLRVIPSWQAWGCLGCQKLWFS